MIGLNVENVKAGEFCSGTASTDPGNRLSNRKSCNSLEFPSTVNLTNWLSLSGAFKVDLLLPLVVIFVCCENLTNLLFWWTQVNTSLTLRALVLAARLQETIRRAFIQQKRALRILRTLKAERKIGSSFKEKYLDSTLSFSS